MLISIIFLFKQQVAMGYTMLYPYFRALRTDPICTPDCHTLHTDCLHTFLMSTFAPGNGLEIVCPKTHDLFALFQRSRMSGPCEAFTSIFTPDPSAQVFGQFAFSACLMISLIVGGHSCPLTYEAFLVSYVIFIKLSVLYLHSHCVLVFSFLRKKTLQACKPHKYSMKVCSAITSQGIAVSWLMLDKNT